MAKGGNATVLSDEDMTFGFVLVDEHAPTAEAAREALLETARGDWDVVFLDESEIAAGDAARRWYKDTGDEEYMAPCALKDPDRDSEWWRFTLPEWESVRDHRWRLEAEATKAAGGKELA